MVKMINKILFITLSNIGDVILTLPTLDCLRENFPEARITVMAGPRPAEIFRDNPDINRLIVYDKQAKLKGKLRLFRELKKENFDAVVDLRNSFFGAFLSAKYRNSPFLVIPKNIKHMKDRHLYKLPTSRRGRAAQAAYPPIRYGGVGNTDASDTAGRLTPGSQLPTRFISRQRNFLYLRPEDEEYISNILKENNITLEDKIIVIAPGARSHIKRWAKESYVELISWLVKELKAKIILVGDKDDVSINKYIAEQSGHRALDLSGKTSIAQLGYLLKKAGLLITNDSAVLHLGSYLDIPTVAVFGPTNEEKYGPWSKIYSIAKKDIFCRPCEKAQCRFGTLKCMEIIKTEDVLRQVKDILVHSSQFIVHGKKNNFRRILIVRTDRIGDVLLSTPVIKAVRQRYPCAYIAMMVSPYAEDIAEGNPYLDEVIIYDKNARHKSWINSLGFAMKLKKKRFDLAIVLHPTNRVHLLTFSAGIPRRLGYDRKLGFLLTDRIKHTKQLGQKHELEYNLDLLNYLGISVEDKSLFMPIKTKSENWVKELFKAEGVSAADKLLAIHPGASCLSKIWPAERFAQAAERLAEKYGFKVLVIAGPKDIKIATEVVKNIKYPVINLAGKTSVSQLASLLKKCYLFISNDSGPVHIASAVGTPVISVFGRSQKGLSPTRWGPRGEKDRILHKEAGCIECLAHNCVKGFACLKAITVDEIIEVADSIIRNP
jgi:heptosyltransferase-2